jgi:eukaryotic-like serine/threonine-protein kinase
MNIGQTIAHYRITGRPAGAGADGAYRAEDSRANRTVALRILSAAAGSAADLRGQLLADARSASALDHPNISSLHDIFETDNTLVLVLPWYDGESLRAKIARGPMRVEAAISIARQLAEGLASAHAAGILHRSLHPGSLHVTADGIVKIMDFGVAGLFGDAAGTTVPAGAAYLAPEQLRGREVDGRTDVWAFGVIVYEMLTGRLPFAGDTPAAMHHAILKEEPADPAGVRSDLPGSLVSLCRNCLSKNPSGRPQSMDDVMSLLGHWPFDLAAITASDPSRFRGRHIALIVVILVLIAGGLVFVLRSCQA